jgi:serine/threonine protein kinase
MRAVYSGKVGRYEIVRALGDGGMAAAYLARHPSGAEVVLKVPHVLDEQTVERVRDEARVGVRLSHPHIVETLDLVEHDNKPVLVVRYIAGCSLRDWWKIGPAPPLAVCHIGAQVADALAWIHEATDESGKPLGILHRDVAPANVLVNTDGEAMLIDLGIARGAESKAQKTELGIIKGTLRYLAPELLDGRPHSVQTDIWALGVCLWELAVGRRAVRGDERAVLTAVMKGELMKLHGNERVDPALTAVLAQMIAPAEQRFSSARAAYTALLNLHAQLGSTEEATAIAKTFVAASPQADNVGEKLGPEVDDDPFAGVSASALPRTDTRPPTDPSTNPPSTPTLLLSADHVPAVVGAPIEGPRAVTFGQMPASTAAAPVASVDEAGDIHGARTVPLQPAVSDSALPELSSTAQRVAPRVQLVPIAIGASLARGLVLARAWFVVRT